jgi:hypothetical protein
MKVKMESRNSLSRLSGRIRKKMVWWKTARGGDAAGLMCGGARKRNSARGAQHAARLRSGSFLVGSANQRWQPPAPRVAVEWLCRGLTEGCLRPEICGLEACRGTMACSSGMLPPKPVQLQDDTERCVPASRVGDHKRHHSVRLSAISQKETGEAW